ncbi:MAG: RDD family protein [Bacteroidales bacterium]|nr:RDD family protein [Bacteroidales bacterium]
MKSTNIGNEILNKTASRGKRFANYLIDFIFLMIFSIILGIIVGIVLAIMSPSSRSIFEQDNELINYLFGSIVGIIYYCVLEATTGKTIAKFITKTKVVNEEGEKPDFGTILLRTLCRLIPFEPFSFLGSDNSGWHDKLSKTRVIEI